MKLQVTRVDQTLSLPTYATSGSCAFDLQARVETVVAPHALALIPANLIVRIPAGYVLMLCSRSSTPKRGLLTPHGFGVIDQDYCGPEDELKIQVLNYTDSPITVGRGDRLAQAMLVHCPRWDFEEVTADGQSRGAFGSTGK
jgi:dUTP pyrophosphatase